MHRIVITGNFLVHSQRTSSSVELDKQQNAAVWQKEKDRVQVQGGGRGGSSRDGKSVRRISSENFLE